MAAGNTNLSFAEGEFVLNGAPLRIYSGAIHYFRVHPQYWYDRLQKAKACGLNTIETYVPWNLHEPRPGHYRHHGILDLRMFIKLIASLELNVILRPGPYICSEWDFGGLPSWLLSDPDMRVRSNYKGYQDAVERYFSWLLPQVVDLQSSQGGPIIAVQVENEYGSFSFDPDHLVWLRDLLWRQGVTELLVTSDNETCAKGLRNMVDESSSTHSAENSVDLFNIPGVLPTANGMTVKNVEAVFKEIRRDRKGESHREGTTEKGQNESTVNISSVASNKSRPLMVMELWSGWFDYWGASSHETTTADSLETTVRYAFSRNASINLYMFHGGTNFGFMNGALQLPRHSEESGKDANDPDDCPFRPDVTSYDYDAPLTEDGCLTGKYLKLRALISEENAKLKDTRLQHLSVIPEQLTRNQRAQTPLIVLSWDEHNSDASTGGVIETLGWKDILKIVSKTTEKPGDPQWMEMYEFPEGAVQSYGYIVYRKSLSSNLNNLNNLKLTFAGRVRDRGTILLNGAQQATVDWSRKDACVSLCTENGNAESGNVLDIMVENQGRVNYTTSDNQARLNTQRKGINGLVSLDGVAVKDWQVFALDFEDEFLERALRSDGWTKVETTGCVTATKGEEVQSMTGPALYRGTVVLPGDTADYFVRLEGWHKGVVFVNGFNLGRYWESGPTKTLYLPAPILRTGKNQVVVFEEMCMGGQIVLDIEPRLG